MSYTDCEPLRVWNRLEPRPRQVELDQVLQARVHDPLWMLTRQWQFGEFHGEDAGSPVLATVARRAHPVTALRRRGAAPVPYAVEDGPLEPLVERLPVTFTPAARAQAGSYLLTLLSSRVAPPAVAAIRGALVDLYPLTRQALDPADESQALSVARRRSSARADRVLRALAGRSVDGVALARALPAEPTWAQLPGPLALAVPSQHADAVLTALRDFRAWFTALWSEPAADTRDQTVAWDGERLEYDHGCTVHRGTGVDLIGASSSAGRADWYSFDLAPGPDSPPATDGTDGTGGTGWEVNRAIPSPAEFAGMPAPRWWQLEDDAVSLSGIRADSGDLAKLLVTDFALVYGNNWLVLPYEQAPGTLCEVGGIVVDDVFGVRTFVGPATGSAGGDWDRWDLFSLSPRLPGVHPVLGQHLFLPPVVAAGVEGPALEEVVFLRDELTNLVWAVESRVPDGVHGGRDGAEAARSFTAALEALAAALSPSRSGAAAAGDGGAATPGGEAGEVPSLTYRLGTGVPGNWIPFLPVRLPGSEDQIRLQRASMPQFFPAGAPRVRPVTSLLRQGMTDPSARAGRYPEALDDGDAHPSPAYLREEEVPRSGVRVTTRAQRARWFGGSTLLWHGRQVRTGRGEGSSGLRHDVIDVPGGPG